MKVDAIRLDLRPRGMFEAADLGVRLVSAHLRSVWTSCAPVYAFVLLLAAAMLPFGTGWAVLTVIWLKPWLDRSILFVLARAVFGEETRFADVWAARRAVAWQGLLGALTIRRLSPWRSYVQPVLQLEGQRGKARRERVARILGPHRGAALAMQTAFATIESALVVGLARAAAVADAGRRPEPVARAAVRRRLVADRRRLACLRRSRSRSSSRSSSAPASRCT